MRPLLAHATGRDHNERAVQVIQLLRFAGLADILQALESERVLPVVEVLARLFVETFLMLAMPRR